MNKIIVVFFCALILVVIGCSSKVKSLSVEVVKCREYLATCGYLVTSSVSQEQYQTDNYTIDQLGNLVIDKYVIVRSKRADDYTIYEVKKMIGGGQYTVDSIPKISVQTDVNSNKEEVTKKQDIKVVQDDSKNVDKNIVGSDIPITKSVNVVDNTSKSFETKMKEIGDFLFKW